MTPFGFLTCHLQIAFIEVVLSSSHHITLLVSRIGSATAGAALYAEAHDPSEKQTNIISFFWLSLIDSCHVLS